MKSYSDFMKATILLIYEKLKVWLSSRIEAIKARIEAIKAWPIFQIEAITVWIKAIYVMSIVVVPLLFLILYIIRPIPTLIQAHLVTERVTFKVNQDTSLEEIPFKEIRIGEGLVEAALRLENGETLQIETDPNARSPEMQVEVANPTTLGTLSPLEIKAGTQVTLEFKEEEDRKQLSLELWAQNHTSQLINLVFVDSILDVSVRGGKIGQEVYEVKKFPRKRLSPRYPSIEVKWQGETRRLLLTLNSNSKLDFLAKPLPASGLEFLIEKLANGERLIKPVIKQGTISYPQLQKNASKEIEPSSFIFFAKQDQFFLEKMVFNPKVNGIEMHLSGKAKGSLSTIPIGLINSEDKESARHDYRLTRWDVWVEGDPFWNRLINMILWLFPIVIGLVAIVKVEVARTSSEEEIVGI